MANKRKVTSSFWTAGAVKLVCRSNWDQSKIIWMIYLAIKYYSFLGISTLLIPSLLPVVAPR